MGCPLVAFDQCLLASREGLRARRFAFLIFILYTSLFVFLLVLLICYMICDYDTFFKEVLSLSGEQNRFIKRECPVEYLHLKLTVEIEPRHDKTNKMAVRPEKTQISLGIRPV